MHKSTTPTFVLLASSMVMLGVTPLFNNNNNNAAMAQGYYDDNSIIAHIPPKIKNMNVEQVHLKASL
jgi:hypothetical protein